MKVTKLALIAITALTFHNVFGAESPAKPVPKRARSVPAAESAVDVDATANLLASLPSPSGGRGAVADNNNSSSSTSTTNIMTEMLHIPEEQVKLREKYRDKDVNDPLLILGFKYYDAIEHLLKHPEKITKEGVQSLFKDFAAEFNEIYPDIINLGQTLQGKSHGVMMCFAIDACISFMKGTGYFDKMDSEEQCVMYNMMHTFYSIMLDGGTDSEQFTTDVAEKVFKEHFDLWDFVPVCCEGTEKNPEGNKWHVLLRQLNDNATNIGLDSKDRETFWWLLGNINSAFRPLFNFANTGKPYTMLVTSITAMQKGYGIDIIGNPLTTQQ